jgi:hypothetical protein
MTDEQERVLQKALQKAQYLRELAKRLGCEFALADFDKPYDKEEWPWCIIDEDGRTVAFRDLDTVEQYLTEKAAAGRPQ